MSNVFCPKCDRVLSAQELANRWCESCGHRIPLYVLRTATTEMPSGTGNTAEKVGDSGANTLTAPAKQAGGVPLPARLCVRRTSAFRSVLIFLRGPLIAAAVLLAVLLGFEVNAVVNHGLSKVKAW
jgi:hypothetical protein